MAPVTYYDSEHVTMIGEIVPAQFPASVPRTPAEVPCGDKVAPDYRQWEHPTWQALNFSVSDPHYYSYQFDSAGAMDNGSFTASAFGDLDCDGIYSTFVRTGVVENGRVRGGAGLFQMDELE